MPTARPIIVTMLSAKTETMKPSPSSAVSASADDDGDHAEQPAGSAPRRAEPNTTSRITSAIGMPITSPRRRSVSAIAAASRSQAPLPVRSTVKPSSPSAELTHDRTGRPCARRRRRSRRHRHRDDGRVPVRGDEAAACAAPAQPSAAFRRLIPRGRAARAPAPPLRGRRRALAGGTGARPWAPACGSTRRGRAREPRTPASSTVSRPSARPRSPCRRPSRGVAPPAAPRPAWTPGGRRSRPRLSGSRRRRPAGRRAATTTASHAAMVSQGRRAQARRVSLSWVYVPSRSPGDEGATLPRRSRLSRSSNLS